MTRVFLLAVLCAVMMGAAPVPATGAVPSGRVSSVQVSAGRVEFLFSAEGLPTAAALDPKSVKVTAAGRDLVAQAEPPGAARPVDGGGAQLGRAVMIVLDTSGSLGASDLRAARLGALAYLRRLPKDVAAGLTTTGSTPSLRATVSPTTDRGVLSNAVRTIRTGGGTALFDAIAISLAQMPKARAENRRLVVLSDGKDSASRAATLAGVTGDLKRDQVPVDVVAFRTQAASEATLRQLATASGGRLFQPTQADRLVSAFAEAAGTLSQAMWVKAAIPAGLGGRTSVRVDVTAGSVKLQTTTAITLPAPARNGAAAPAASAQRAPTGAVEPAGRGSAMLLIILAVCFAAFVFTIFAVVSLATGSARPGWERQIDHYGTQSEEAVADGDRGTLFRGALRASQRFLDTGDLEERLARDLDRAGMSMRPHEWTLLRAALAVAVIASIFALTGNAIAGVLLGALLTWLVTRLYLKGKVSRRLTAFADQLPDALQLVAGSLRSGFTVSQALERLARQENQPLAAEMSRAVAETRLGVSVEDALDKTADRMECRDLNWVVLAIRIQREVGGNLAEVIETTVETMRERTRLRRHVRALSAEGRLSAYVLIALPIASAALMFLTRPAYMRPLYTEPMGIALLAGGITSIAVGSIWINRMIKVET